MSFFKLILTEFKAILTNPAIVLTVIGGAIFYSFLYPQPYINQTPREQKVILIDNDNTPFSRDFARKVNATPQVKLTSTGYNINEAKEAITNGKVSGYLLIPKDFYKNIKLQKSPTLVYGANASYFLVYGSIAEAIFDVAKAVSSDILLKRQLYKTNNSLNPTPINLVSKPAFNPTIGYINYVIPAVFILIFHQIMLIGAGIQGGTQNELKQGYWQKVSPLKLILARLLVYLVIYLPIGIYYMGFCFNLYSVPHLSNISTLLLMTAPLVISATALGMVIGELVPRKELATFIVLVSSLPLVFTSGFIWPIHSITPILTSLVQFIPTTPAILAFLQINQMGADFTQIYDKWLQVCILGIFYLLIAFYLMRRKHNHLHVKDFSNK